MEGNGTASDKSRRIVHESIQFSIIEPSGELGSNRI